MNSVNKSAQIQTESHGGRQITAVRGTDLAQPL